MIKYKTRIYFQPYSHFTYCLYICFTYLKINLSIWRYQAADRALALHAVNETSISGTTCEYISALLRI